MLTVLRERVEPVVTVEKADLAEALAMVRQVVQGNTTLPVLSHVLLQWGEKWLTLTGTDLETVAQRRVPALAVQPGEVTVPAGPLHKLVEKLPAGPVSLRLDGEAPKLTLEGEGYRATLVGLPADEFPEGASSPGEGELVARMGAGVLARVLGASAPLASKNDSRPVLTGVRLVLAEGKMKLLATDGFRLARLEEAVTTIGALDAILPAAAARLVASMGRKAPGEVQCWWGGTNLRFEFDDGGMIVAHAVEGSFPDVESVLESAQKASNTRVETARESLLGAFQMADVVSATESGGCTVTVTAGGNSLLLRATNTELGESEQVVPAVVTGEGLAYLVQARFMMDVLGLLQSKMVCLEFSEAMAPVVVRADGQEEGGAVYMVAAMRPAS